MRLSLPTVGPGAGLGTRILVRRYLRAEKKVGEALAVPIQPEARIDPALQDAVDHEVECAKVGLERLRSFRAVADLCGLSQPAVSRAIGRIETRLDARLFDRTSRSVLLTPQGRAFLPIAKRIVRDLSMSLDELRTSFSGEEGEVSLAVLPSVAFSILPRVIRDFRRDHPAIRISIVDTLLGGVEAAIAAGEVDFGVAVVPTRRDHGSAGISFAVLTTDSFVALLRFDDPLAFEEEVGWQDLADGAFVAMAATTSVRDLTDRAFAAIGRSVDPAYEVAHLASAGALVAAGLGRCALPELTFPAVRHPDLVTRPLTGPAVTRTIGILQRSGKTLSPAAARLRTRLCETFDLPLGD